MGQWSLGPRGLNNGGFIEWQKRTHPGDRAPRAAGLLPENTLAGFRFAVDLGVDGVECDVHVTRDGQMVVMHDDNVDRTTNGAGKVADLSLEQIRGLDAGGSQQVPTLAELLDLLGSRCHLYCELKADGTEELAVHAVLSRKMQSQVTFISFEMRRLANVRRYRDNLRIGALFAAPTMKDLAPALDLGVCYVGTHDRYVVPALVEQIHRRHAAAGAWTPSQLDAMLAMTDLGVTHITTDRPDVLLHYLGRLNGRLAQAERMPAGLTG